jgi:TonB family protein
MALVLALIMKRGKRAVIMIMAVMLAVAQFAQGQVTEAKREALYMPRLQYPSEARSKGIGGSGAFVLHIDPKDGNVRSVTVAHSTGSPILDNAAKAGMRQWRFRPGPSEVHVPISVSFVPGKPGVSYWRTPK